MKILVDMGHPAHVHLFKNLIWELEKQGHSVQVTARDKDVVLKLLDAYKIPYIKVGKKGSGTLALAKEWICRELQILSIARSFHPDVMIGVLNPATVHVAKLVGAKSVIFNDSEPEAIKYPIAEKITIPFANLIVTLASVKHDYGPTSIRVNSYKELAYLHPDVFTPDSSVLLEAGLAEDEEYALIRFVAWGAYHDVGEGGFRLEDKRLLITELEKRMKVYISSELPLSDEFEKYRLPITPDRMHDFMYYAKIFVSDSQTMTTEAAVLGTPAVRCNSFVGENDMGNFQELENKYGLIFNYRDAEDAIMKVRQLVLQSDLKAEWKEKREMLLKEKDSLTTYLVKAVVDDDYNDSN